MRIGIAYNLKGNSPNFFPSSSAGDHDEEFDSPKTVEAIRQVLAGEGHKVFLLGGDLGIIEKIRQNKIEFVFNIAEGFAGRNRVAHIPALLEMMRIPYSGSDPLGLAATLDKSIAKRIALSLSIPTPDFWVLEKENEAEKIPERFPLFIKPLWQGSSKGVRRSSRAGNRGELKEEVTRLLKDYPDEPVLTEVYVPGRELTVGVLGNGTPEVLGIMEIAFRNKARKDFCYSIETKRNWREEVEYDAEPALDSRLEQGISEAALSLFKALGLRDVARFDFRVNPEEGKFYFLETNPLPGLSPESGDLVILAQKKGWSFRQLILKITQFALSRYNEK